METNKPDGNGKSNADPSRIKDEEVLRPGIDDMFGLCPKCLYEDGYLNLGREQWFYCLECKKTWNPGSNLLDSWRKEDVVKWWRNYVFLSAFEKVDPAYLPRPKHRLDWAKKALHIIDSDEQHDDGLPF